MKLNRLIRFGSQVCVITDLPCGQIEVCEIETFMQNEPEHEITPEQYEKAKQQPGNAWAIPVSEILKTRYEEEGEMSEEEFNRIKNSPKG